MKKIISLVFLIIVANNLLAQDTSKFIMPLNLGNKWQYINHARGSDNYSKYSLSVNVISRDTTIDNKKYFFYWGGLPTRYDYDSNTVYIYYQGGDKQIIDFKKNNGEYFNYFNVKNGVYDSLILNRDTGLVLNHSLPTASFEENLPYIERFFASKIGLYYTYSSSSGPGGGSRNSTDLINAIIYDSLGNMTYYTDSAKSNFGYTPLNITGKENISFTIYVGHPNTCYGSIFNDTKLDINFTDSVSCQYFYEKDGIAGDTFSISLRNIATTIKYVGYMVLDRTQLDNGYKLKYRFCATDKALIPSTACTEYLIAQDNITGVESDPLSIIEFNLEQNYPNPFNPVTTIKYSIEKPSNVVIKIFDVLGNEVTKLVDEPKERGYYSVDFDASKLASGIYYYSISAGEFYSVKKMVLLK